jgi:alkylated DNA nucleotide flippase Atl1
VSEAKLLGIQKTRKQVMKALALTTPSQLSFHFVIKAKKKNE